MYHLQNSKGTELPLGLVGCIVIPERPKLTPNCVTLGNIHIGHPVDGILLIPATSIRQVCQLKFHDVLQLVLGVNLNSYSLLLVFEDSYPTVIQKSRHVQDFACRPL